MKPAYLLIIGSETQNLPVGSSQKMIAAGIGIPGYQPSVFRTAAASTASKRTPLGAVPEIKTSWHLIRISGFINQKTDCRIRNCGVVTQPPQVDPRNQQAFAGVSNIEDTGFIRSCSINSHL